MLFWLVSCGVLFAAFELFQWFRQVTLPLPLAIAAGGLLAIASNKESLPPEWRLNWRNLPDQAAAPRVESATERDNAAFPSSRPQV